MQRPTSECTGASRGAWHPATTCRCGAQRGEGRRARSRGARRAGRRPLRAPPAPPGHGRGTSSTSADAPRSPTLGGRCLRSTYSVSFDSTSRQFAISSTRPRSHYVRLLTRGDPRAREPLEEHPRPREMRDITVPIGAPTISRFPRRRTPRRRGARPPDGTRRAAQSRADWRSTSSVSRVSNCSGLCSSAAQVGGPLDGLAVHVHRAPHVVPPHVPERVVENREQPRFQVRSRFELSEARKAFRYVSCTNHPHQLDVASAVEPFRRGCPHTTAPPARTRRFVPRGRRTGAREAA